MPLQCHGTPMASTLPVEVLRCIDAEEVRGFEAHLAAPVAEACGGLRGEGPAVEALARPGGAVCVGRVMDILRDERRFYDTGAYAQALGMADLPGACPVFRLAFRKGLVLPAGGGFAAVDDVPREELLLVRAAASLQPRAPRCLRLRSAQSAKLAGAALSRWIWDCVTRQSPSLHAE